MKKVIIGIICALSLVLAVNSAQALTILAIGDPEYVGSINDGIPSNPAAEIGYIGTLIGLPIGQVDISIGTETYNREDSTLAPLPAVNLFLSKDESGSYSFTAANAGNLYLLGKYDAGKAGSLVFLVNAAMNDVFELPATYNGHDISHLSAYSTKSVPEPTTLLLVGLGLVGVAGVRRKLRK